MKRNRRLPLSAALMLIVFAVGIIAGFRQMRPPSPPTESEPDYPAYQRMLAHVEAIASAPHPSGSNELEKVRSYLLAQIREMGLTATVENEIYTVDDVKAQMEAELASNQTRIVKNNREVPQGSLEEDIRRDFFDGKDEWTLKNIVVKLDSPNTDRGVLMMAHYDTEDEAPGAADDTVAVSALLEAMREQANRHDLQNDLYFLFTDGEEKEAWGAKAFVKSHPELQHSIDLVVNMDARGDRGGLIMFETSANNYDLMRDYRSASSLPLAFSYLSALYHKMPNGTDLTSFLDAGYTGLNFAVAEGVEHYHQPSDNFENLNRGTAYHFLRTALDMVEYAAQAKLQDGSSHQDGVYFPFLRGHLVLMSNVTAYILTAFVSLASLVWLVYRIRTGRVRLRQIVYGTGWLLGTTAAMALLSRGIAAMATKFMHTDASANNETIFLCQAFALAAGALAIFFFRMRKQPLGEAVAGLLPLQLVLMMGAAVFFVSISYLFTLPTLGLLIVAVLERTRLGRSIASIVIGIGILLLYVPTCWLIYVMFMLPMAPLVTALSMLPISMIAAFFASQDLLTEKRSTVLNLDGSVLRGSDK